MSSKDLKVLKPGDKVRFRRGIRYGLIGTVVEIQPGDPVAGDSETLIVVTNCLKDCIVNHKSLVKM
jgi:hypothetical protein